MHLRTGFFVDGISIVSCLDFTASKVSGLQFMRMIQLCLERAKHNTNSPNSQNMNLRADFDMNLYLFLKTSLYDCTNCCLTMHWPTEGNWKCPFPQGLIFWVWSTIFFKPLKICVYLWKNKISDSWFFQSLNSFTFPSQLMVWNTDYTFTLQVI